MADPTEIIETVYLVEIVSGTTNTVETLSTSDTVVEVAVPGPAGPQPTVPAAIVYVFDGCEAPIAVGVKAGISVPFNCTIQSWTLTGAPSGSITVDVLKTGYAGWPTLTGASITGGAKPAITAGQKGSSSNLTAWSPNLLEGDIIVFNVESCSAITLATLTLKVIRTP